MEPDMLTVTLDWCKIKSVRADMVAGTVRITFETALSTQFLKTKRHLALLAADKTPVSLTVEEQQLRLGGELNVCQISPDPPGEGGAP